MANATDIFQRFILREAVLSEGLMDEIHRADWVEKLAPTLADTTAAIIASVTRGTLGAAATGPAAKLTRDLIVSACRSSELLESWRCAVLTYNDVFSGGDVPAHSCFKSALAFAISGQYADADRWVEWGTCRKSDLARGEFVLGLLAGVQNGPFRAVPHLDAALSLRADDETKVRIREVLEEARRLCSAGR